MLGGDVNEDHGFLAQILFLLYRKIQEREGKQNKNTWLQNA
jgi:hypothetical protein